MNLEKKVTDSLIAYLEDLKSFNVNFIALKNEMSADQVQFSKKETKNSKGLDMKTPKLPFNPDKKMNTNKTNLIKNFFIYI